MVHSLVPSASLQSVKPEGDGPDEEKKQTKKKEPPKNSKSTKTIALIEERAHG